MLVKLAVVFLLATSVIAQTNVMICNFAIIDDKCSCNLVIFNPDGSPNIPVLGNPIQNCNFTEVKNVYGTGIASSIPDTVCSTMPNIEILQLHNMQIVNLANNPFQECRSLKSLILSQNAITELTALTFANTVLETLILAENKIVNVASTTFNSLTYLKELDLSSNVGIELGNEVFDPLSNLTSLNLRKCGIQDITSRWLSNLINLVSLDLGNNYINTTINQLTFKPLTKLSILNLDINEIPSLNPDTFYNNTELTILNLSRNELTELPSNIFANQAKLISLSLSSNKFEDFTFTSPLFDPLQSLQSIDLSGCSINEDSLGSFATLSSLVYIDLGDNKIKSLDEHVFSATNNLMHFDISKNSITELNSRSFGSLSSLTNLNVEGNTIAAVDHHFINQSMSLLNVNFNLNLGCVQFETEDFNSNKTSYMTAMKECFDNFDMELITLTTSNSEIFEWYNIRSDDGWEALEVSVKAEESVHIGLSSLIDDVFAPIEVRLGENHNYESNIFENDQLVFNDTIRGRLNRTEEVSFTIGWRFNVLLVFKKGDQFPFMIHPISNQFPVNFFGLRSMIDPQAPNSNAEWKVTRINMTPSMSTVYRDIQAKMRMGMPLNFNQYLR